ncbi:MAG: hypothetical protein QOJ99_5594 [Bryobacterales bacterium]|nr:hypothetical protein [Bryobacterales bacterium]
MRRFSSVPGKEARKLRSLQKVAFVVLVCTLAAAAAAAQDTSAGSKYFVAAQNALKNGAEADAASSAEKGWSAVLAAGPARPGFIEAAHDASNIFLTLGRALRAGAVYKEAKAQCATASLQPAKLRLQYMHADHLIRKSEYVNAESILRDAISTEDRSPQKSTLYVAFLQTLAFVCEQQGSGQRGILVPNDNRLSIARSFCGEDDSNAFFR